jgi:hypothetical protein
VGGLAGGWAGEPVVGRLDRPAWASAAAGGRGVIGSRLVLTPDRLVPLRPPALEPEDSQVGL